MSTVYISIENSDDKLTQLEWHEFADDVDQAVRNAARYAGTQVHGRWYSLPTEPWQNACWCIDFADDLSDDSADAKLTLRRTLARLARQYRQDSIAWASAKTEFIGAQP
jgi:hypothetical protein